MRKNIQEHRWNTVEEKFDQFVRDWRNVADPACRHVPLQGKLLCTLGLMFVCFFLMIAGLIVGQGYAPLKENPMLGPSVDTLIILGGLKNYLVREGQWWRLLWAGYLHAGWFHLAMNSLLWYKIGIMIEPDWGFLRTLLVFNLSILSGNLLSTTLDPEHVSVGASGGLFGLMSATIPYVIEYWHTIHSPKFLIYVLILSTLVGLACGFLPYIDNYAHIGGAIGGVLGGFLCIGKVEMGTDPPIRRVLRNSSADHQAICRRCCDSLKAQVSDTFHCFPDDNKLPDIHYTLKHQANEEIKRASSSCSLAGEKKSQSRNELENQQLGTTSHPTGLLTENPDPLIEKQLTNPTASFLASTEMSTRGKTCSETGAVEKELDTLPKGDEEDHASNIVPGREVEDTIPSYAGTRAASIVSSPAREYGDVPEHLTTVSRRDSLSSTRSSKHYDIKMEKASSLSDRSSPIRRETVSPMSARIENYVRKESKDDAAREASKKNLVRDLAVKSYEYVKLKYLWRPSRYPRVSTRCTLRTVRDDYTDDHFRWKDRRVWVYRGVAAILLFIYWFPLFFFLFICPDCYTPPGQIVKASVEEKFEPVTSGEVLPIVTTNQLRGGLLAESERVLAQLDESDLLNLPLPPLTQSFSFQYSSVQL